MKTKKITNLKQMRSDEKQYYTDSQTDEETESE